MLLDDISIATRLRRAEADHFNYASGPIAVPGVAGTGIAFTIPIDADADYIWCKSMLVSYTAVGTILANPDYTFTIADSGAGRNLQNAPVHVNTGFGTAQLPFILPEPKMIKASSVLTITLINATAVAAVANVTLSGFKLFYMAGWTRDTLFAK